MAITQKLQTRLSQKLVLTPSLQQAIKLLPMTTLELAELLNQEMVENPMLEEVSTEELQTVEPQAQTSEPEAPEAPKPDRPDANWDEQDYAYFFGEYLDDGGYRSRMPVEVKELPPIENTLSTSGTLADHLLWQLSMRLDISPDAREIGEAIIGNLNDDGYLVASVDELAQMGDWTPSRVEEVLTILQHLDPVGVAARDLQECLTLQLRHQGYGNTPSDVIVTEHLRLLQNHQVPEIAKRMGMPIEQLKDHIEIIRNLDPKPGSRFNPAPSQYVMPDVYIVKVEDQYVAALNNAIGEEILLRIAAQVLERQNAERWDHGVDRGSQAWCGHGRPADKTIADTGHGGDPLPAVGRNAEMLAERCDLDGEVALLDGRAGPGHIHKFGLGYDPAG